MEGLCRTKKARAPCSSTTWSSTSNTAGKRTFFTYTAACAACPEDDADRLALYGFLLELNSFFKGTDGGVLGIEPSLDAVTYTVRTPLASLDEIGLDALLGRHVNAVESLRALH